MAANWDAYGKKAYQGLKENGITAIVSYEEKDGDYNIATGKNSTTIHQYSTHAILKNFTTEFANIVDPEDVEISFHSGAIPDTIPDLMDKKNISIDTGGKTYSVIHLKVVRPAGITMLYKARAKETGTSS